MTPEMLAFQICVQARLPVHLWGEPGIGKSTITEAVAQVLDQRLWPVLLSIREPSDQGGLPVIRDDFSVWMAPPRWAKELDEHGGGWVFLDELNTAAPAVQNSALRVVQERYAGDARLPDATSFVAAGNPPETNPGVYDLTPAMANRFVHIRWPNDHEGWIHGMVSGWPAPKVVRLPDDWREGLPSMNGLVADFISKRGELLHQKPDNPVDQGRAWPSNRMWTTAAVGLAAANSCGHDPKSHVARVIVAGCVGDAASIEFASHIANMDLRDPEEYLANPDNIPLPRRQDQMRAALSQVAAAALKERPKRKEMIQRYYAAWKVLARVMRQAKDIAIPAARILADAMPPECDSQLPPELDDILDILENAQIDFSQVA